MRVSLVSRCMVGGSHAAKTSCRIVDVVDDGVGAFLLEEEDEVDVARVGRRGDADEGDLGGARATGVIDGVADVVDLAAGVGFEDAQQSLGVRFVVLHVVHADHGMEDHAAGEAVAR